MKPHIHWKKPLSPENLFNPIINLQYEINNIFQKFYEIFQTSSSKHINERQTLNPYIDMIEDDKAFKIEAEIPGMDENDIRLTIKNKMLTIEGKKEISKKDEDKEYISREINYGYYKRDISLPDDIDIDKANASFKKGMLWITFPKNKESTANRREIKIEKATHSE